MLNRLQQRSTDWKYQWQQRGWRAATPDIFKDLITLAYTRIEYVIVARSLLATLPPLRPSIDLYIRPFTWNDLDAVQTIAKHPAQFHNCFDRLQKNHFGYAALHRNQLVGYAWSMDGSTAAINQLLVEIPPKSCLCSDVFVAPAFRRRGIHTALSIARMQHYQREGYERAFAYLPVDNLVALSMWRNIGGMIAHHVTYQRLGFWRRIRRYPLPILELDTR